MPARYLHPMIVLLTGLLAGAGVVRGEDLQQREPFATIAFPPHGEVGSEVTVTVRTRGAAIAQPTRLVVDMHAMVGSARRAGLGTQSWDLVPGQDQTFRATFTVPPIQGVPGVPDRAGQGLGGAASGGGGGLRRARQGHAPPRRRPRRASRTPRWAASRAPSSSRPWR